MEIDEVERKLQRQNKMKNGINNIQTNPKKASPRRHTKRIHTRLRGAFPHL